MTGFPISNHKRKDTQDIGFDYISTRHTEEGRQRSNQLALYSFGDAVNGDPEGH